MSTNGSSRLALPLTALLAAVPLYLLVTYQHCRGPGEGGAMALVGSAGECVPTGPIAIVRAPVTTLAIAVLVVAVCYALAAVAVFALRR